MVEAPYATQSIRDCKGSEFVTNIPNKTMPDGEGPQAEIPNKIVPVGKGRQAEIPNKTMPDNEGPQAEIPNKTAIW